MHSCAVKRITDVSTMIRARQFPEDSGAMSHPIRPDSYIEMVGYLNGLYSNRSISSIVVTTYVSPDSETC